MLLGQHFGIACIIALASVLQMSRTISQPLPKFLPNSPLAKETNVVIVFPMGDVSSKNEKHLISTSRYNGCGQNKRRGGEADQRFG